MTASMRALLADEDGEAALPAPAVLGVVVAACVSLVAVTAGVAICGLCDKPKTPPKPGPRVIRPPQQVGPGGYPRPGGPNRPPGGPGGHYPQYPPNNHPHGPPHPGSHGPPRGYRHHPGAHPGAYTEVPAQRPPSVPQADVRRPSGPPPDIMMTNRPGDRPTPGGGAQQWPDRQQRTSSGAGQGYPDPRMSDGRQNGQGSLPGGYRPSHGQDPYHRPPQEQRLPPERQESAPRPDERLHTAASVQGRDESLAFSVAAGPTGGANEQQQADIMLASATVDDTVRLLHAVCDRMGGAVQAQFTLHKDSIRPGINAAVAEVTTRFGTEVTVAFFPDKNRKAKQMKMYEKNTMKDFMPVVSDESGPCVYQENGVSVALPAHIYVDRCTTLRDAMRQCSSARDTLHELFTICQNLTKQLQMQHRRSICLRDINARNIVRANVGTTRSWTLLEYCNAMRAGNKTEVLPAWCTPPELAAARLRNEPVVLQPSFDMWQLGTFVYEVATGKPYWPTSMTDLNILNTLADTNAPLPHEERPVNTELVQRILSQLLTRSASHRLSAESLKKLLDKEEETGTLAATINAGKAMTEGPVVFEN